MLRFLLFIVMILPISLMAQVTGGESVMQFLRLSPAPRISALGGMNIVHSSDNDMSLAMQNPAMLHPGFHNTMVYNHNFFLSKTQVSNLMVAHYDKKNDVVWASGINYLNYGQFNRTDVFGNSMGNFTANSFVLYASAAKKYLEKWRYGSTVKWAYSRMDNYTSSALMADVGVVYADTVNGWYLAGLAKNFGFQTKKFTKANNETLPFDIQLAFHRKFKKSPLRIGVLMHHLYQWDVRYDNPADIVSTNLFGTVDTTKKLYIGDKILRHLVFSADIILSKRLELSFGYNHMRRQELSVSTKQGMSGFSFGAGLNLGKFQLRYARSIQNVASNYNEIGLNMNLYSAFGLGKKIELPVW